MYGYIFTYDHKRYMFSANISDKDLQSGTILLEDKGLGLFSYTNELNNLILHGTLEYTDTDGRIDTFIDQQYVYLNVTFTEITSEGDGNVLVDKYDIDKTITITFFVDNIEVMDNAPGRIQYRFHLIGSNWFLFLRKLDYTNYSGSKETVMSIIRNLLIQCKVPIDYNAFDTSDSATKMFYITGNNDNLHTAIPFLLNKLYYSDEYGMDTNMKALVYNEFEDKVTVFDTGLHNKYQLEHNIEINQMVNDGNVDNQSDTNIAYVLKKNKTLVMYDNIRNQIYSYSMESNTFGKQNIESSYILKYYAGKHKYSKFEPLVDDILYYRSQPSWNNSIDLYNKQLDNFKYNGALIVNIHGFVGIIPGYLIGITCPIKEELFGSESAKLIEEMKKKYQSITGYWYALKVTTFINPAKSMFRQTICLMRDDKVLVN